MRNKTRQSARRRQRGVALLLALGVLSLLMVTGLAFVSNSMLARKSAANFRGRAQAKMIASSTINRIMLQLKYYMHEGQSTHFGNLVSKNTHADGSHNDVFNDGLGDLLSGVVDGVNVAAGGNAEWTFLYDIYDDGEIVTGKSNDAENSRIIGRAAYAAVPAAANVNFSEVLRGHPDVVGSSNSVSSWEKRRGVSIRELNFGADQFNDIEDGLDTLAERFKSNEDFENKVEKLDKNYAARDYQSFDEIEAAVNLPAEWNRNLRRYMLTSGYNDAEIFAVDTGADANDSGFSGSAKFYHRFNLLRDDWNSLTVSDLLGDAREFNFKDDNLTDDDIKSLPWLRFIHDTKGNYPSLEARRRQVAANLLAYCSPEGRNAIAGKGTGASHNVLTSADDWWDEVPEYTGNKKTFYINEISVAPKVEIVRTNRIVLGPPRLTIATYRANVYIGGIGVEVVNMYGITNGDMKARIAGEAIVAVTLPNGSREEKALSFDTTGNVDLPLTFNGIYGYGVIVPTGAIELTATQLERPTGNEKAVIELVGLKIDKMMLCDASGNPVDFVRTLEKNNFNITLANTPILNQAGAYECTGYMGFEVDDPRENLYQGSGTEVNWTETYRQECYNTAVNVAAFEALGSGSAQYEPSFGKKNYACNHKSYDGTERDKESSDDLDNLSTAYIRHGLMESPVELGAIHRAAKWQTINLKNSEVRVWTTETSNPSENPDEANGFTYAQGDAAILDQVKMTERIFSPGKVNLNIYPEEEDDNFLFQALFEGVKYGMSSAENYDDGAAVDKALAETLRDTLGENISTRKRFLSRAAMIGYEPTSGNRLFNAYGKLSSLDNDIQQEALVAKTALLTTVNTASPNVLSFLLAAQSVKDIGGGFNMVKNKENSTDTVTREVNYAKFDLEDGVYFDEITGEVKMLVTIQVDNETQKVRLLNATHID